MPRTSRPIGTLRGRVPSSPSIYRRNRGGPRASGTLPTRLPPPCAAPPRPRRPRAVSVLGAAEALDGLGHARGRVQDLREADDRDGVFGRDRARVDLFEE